MHYRKSNKPKLLLMLVALLALFAISLGVTFSWIEGGATYTIQSDDENEPIKTDKVPDTVYYSGKITLNPAESTSNISLVKYDENTSKYQDLSFSPVSSKDGENFFFPVSNNDGTTAFYREGKINDIGTKYIKYDFDIAGTTKNCYVVFNGEPTIKAVRNNYTVSDTSAFRVMIKCGDDQHFFTTADTEQSSTVATNTTGGTTTLKAVPFDDFVNNSDKAAKLFSFKKGFTGNIEVSIWLDDGSDFSTLEGCEITINMDLIVIADDVTATFNAVTYDKTGTKVSNGFTGGSIKYGTTTHTASFEKSGTIFNATAVPKSGYDFIGWFSDSACTKLVTEDLALSESPDGDMTYFAKFLERNVTTIYFETRSGFTTYSVYAYNEDDYSDGTHHYTGTETTLTNNWPGASATYDSTTGYYKFEFTTTDIGTFNVIISNSGSDVGRYPASNEPGLEGNIGGTYLFTADNTLIEFDPADMITVKADSSSGGTATLNGATADLKLRPGQTVTIKANAATNYKFVGWYTSSDCTTTIGSTYKTATQTITLSANDAGETLTYYAKFEKIPTLTLKTSVKPTGGGTATVNSASSATVQIGSTATLKASAASGYRFAGWYTNEACTTTTGITNPTSATSAKYTVSGTADSTVTLYAKFVKTYTAKAYAVTGTTSSDSTGGTVQVGTASSGATSTLTVDTGKTATFKAVANTGYEFKGWYTAATGGTLKSEDDSYTVTMSANTTLYARFEQTSKVIYMSASHWLVDGAKLGVYVWTGSTNEFVLMTDSDGDGIYSCEIDPKYTDIIFLRLNSSVSSSSDISWSSVWNQTADQTIPTNGNNFFTVPSGGWTGTGGTWSKK